MMERPEMTTVAVNAIATLSNPITMNANCLK